MTSLERQLKRLKTPQTEAFRQQKYRASFLYDRKDAATIDCDTHLRLANKSLKKLIKLNPELEKYKDLFDAKSKECERAVMLTDEHDRLTKKITKFIHKALVPYFMLNDCHEVIEYLIYKYQVHNYQPNDLIFALLPYHETRLFARLLQTMNLTEGSLWDWLEPYAKQGISVPKQRIIDVLAHRSRVSLVSMLGDKLLEINHDTDKAGVFNSFYTTTIMRVLEQDLDEGFYNVVSQHVEKAIKKHSNPRLFLAGLVLVGYLTFTQELEQSYTERIGAKLLKARTELAAHEGDNHGPQENQQRKDLVDLIDSVLKIQSNVLNV